jgi:hypothetical protein
MARLDNRKKQLAGTPFHSIFEKNLGAQMDKAGVKYEYERDVIVWVQPAQTRKYTPDFFLPNGIIIEAKGKWTIEDRKKMVNVIEQNPDLDIRMLFQYDNKLNKRAKMRYSDWCERREIVYAVGKIPAEWLEEKVDEITDGE